MTTNFLSPNEFRFNVKRLPETSFYVQSVSLPSMTSSNIDLSTPFTNLPIASGKIEYSNLTVTCALDVKMKSYQEIRNWLRQISPDEDFTQRIALEKSNEGIYSDATLHILDNSKNSNIKIVFQDLFPIGISEVMLETKNTSVPIIQVSYDFKYRIFNFV